jgi:hypothetical protein
MTPVELLALADRLQAGADDPMWADHCEMTKTTAGKAAAYLRQCAESMPVAWIADVLRELEDDTNQTLRVKRMRWATIVRAQDAEIRNLRALAAQPVQGLGRQTTLNYLDDLRQRLHDYIAVVPRGETAIATRDSTIRQISQEIVAIEQAVRGQG